MLVLVNGADVRYIKEGVYFIGVYKLSRGKGIKCKVGYVRVGWNEVAFVVNRIGSIEKIMHKPEVPQPAERGYRTTMDSCQNRVHGFCIINFVDTAGALFCGVDTTRGGKIVLEK